MPSYVKYFWIALCLFLCFGRLSAQDNWYDHYANAVDAIAASKWATAQTELNLALQLKKGPQAQAETYALRVVDYVPFYMLGVIYFNRGEFDKALAQFESSEKWGTIQKTDYHPRLLEFKAIAKRILERDARLAELQKQLSDLQDQSNSLAGRDKQLDAIRAAIISGDLPALQRMQEQAENGSGTVLPAPVFAAIIAGMQPGSGPATDSTRADAPLFRNALNAFVAGNYQNALNYFQTLARQSPDYPGVNSWLRRTRSEIQKAGIQLTPQVQNPDTVLMTAEPVVVFTTLETVTRSDSILITGSVRDDQGIDFIQFNLNGKLYSNSAGEPIRFRPAEGDDPRGFKFEIRMPLQMGDNDIFVVAYDTDPNRHSAVYDLTVTRRPPIYRTAAFFWAIGIILFLTLAAIVGNILMKRRLAFVNKYNPYIAGAPIRNEKMFYGRENLLKKIVNTMHGNSLMIFGPRRIGKTSLLHQLKKKLETEKDKDYFYVPVYIDLQGTPESKFFATMMEDIVEGVEPYLSERPALRISDAKARYSARDFSVDIRQVVQHLKLQSTRMLKLVMLIDEVDQLNSYSERANQKLRSIFMKTFAENLVAVMSGSYIRKHWESEGSPWYNFFEEIEVTGIDREIAETLIREPVKGIFSYDDRAVEKILQYSDLIPYRIQKFCVNVISRIIELRRRRVLPEDVEAVKQKVFESIEGIDDGTGRENNENTDRHENIVKNI